MESLEECVPAGMRCGYCHDTVLVGDKLIAVNLPNSGPAFLHEADCHKEYVKGLQAPKEVSPSEAQREIRMLPVVRDATLDARVEQEFNRVDALGQLAYFWSPGSLLVRYCTSGSYSTKLADMIAGTIVADGLIYGGLVSGFSVGCCPATLPLFAGFALKMALWQYITDGIGKRKNLPQ